MKPPGHKDLRESLFTAFRQTGLYRDVNRVWPGLTCIFEHIPGGSRRCTVTKEAESGGVDFLAFKLADGRRVIAAINTDSAAEDVSLFVPGVTTWQQAFLYTHGDPFKVGFTLNSPAGVLEVTVPEHSVVIAIGR